MNYKIALIEQDIRKQRQKVAVAYCAWDERIGRIERDRLDYLYTLRLINQDEQAVINYFERKNG